MITVALDPGIARPGVAVFDDDGVLVHVQTFPNKTKHTDPCTRAIVIGRQAAFFTWPFTEGYEDRIELVVEWPQAYDARKGKSKPGANQALIGLGAVCGAFAADLNLYLVRSVHPAEWKGQIPKKDGNRIIKERVRKRLTEAELAVIPKRLAHDGYDAIGLGLWHLGRFERHRVFPGATQ